MTQIAVVQSTQAHAVGTSVTAPVMMMNPGNAAYVSVVVYGSANAPTISDTNGQSYTALIAQRYDGGGTGRYVSTFYATNIKGGLNAIKASISGSHGMLILAAELTAYAASPFDQSNTNFGFQAPPYGAYVTPAAVPAQGELILSTIASEYSGSSISFSATITNSGGATNPMTILQAQTDGTQSYPSGALAAAIVTANGQETVNWSDGGTGAYFSLAIDCLFGGTSGPIAVTPRPAYLRNRPYFV